MIQYANMAADYLVSLPFPALLILKSTLVLIVGAIIAMLFHRSAASMRYAVWALALTAIIVLPFGMLATPPWSVRIAKAPEPVENLSFDPVSGVPSGSTINNIIYPDKPQPLQVDFTSEQKLLLLWLAGSVLLLGRMVVARISLARLTRKSILLDDADWTRMVLRESFRLGLERRVRLFASDSVSTPLAAGVTDAFIVLPASATEWTDEHKEIVLRHELSHIVRGDALVCVVSGIACAIYWFNPLVWIATRKLRAEQERACDDSVITLGTPPVEYASHLLEVARSARNIGMSSFVSVAMARPSQLEGRLLAVLNNRRRNSLTRTRSAGAVMVALLLVLAVSALRPMRAESAVIVASQTAPVLVTAVKPETELTAPHAADSAVSGSVKVESGGTLVLDLKTGAGVTVRGTNDNRVRVDGILSGRDWRSTSFTINGNERDAFVTLDYLRHLRNTSSSHHLNITVPRRFNVRIESAGGEISIRDVEGSFTGGTGGGEITIRNARGSARLTTGGGEVTVEDSNLSGSVTTGGGSVLIQNVTGGLSGSSGTGDVLYGGLNARERGSPLGKGVGSAVGRGGDRDVCCGETVTIQPGVSGSVKGSVKGGVAGTVAGDVTFSETTVNGTRVSSDGRYYISKSGGDVNITSADNGAIIHTGGGSITIGKTNGDLVATTGGGDVSVSSADGAVEITTGAGDVEINITETGHPVKINSGNGRITLVLPRNMSADLDLETAYTQRNGPTRIRGDWNLATTETTNWDRRQGTPRRYVRSAQAIGGGGPRITVKTVNGDIVLKRR